MPQDALVVARVVRDGRIDPASLGQVRPGPGASANVRIALSREVRSGESLVVTLHSDFGAKGLDDGDTVVLSVDMPVAGSRRASAGRAAMTR